jgi:putative transposase
MKPKTTTARWEERRLEAGELFGQGSSPSAVARKLGVCRQSASRWHGQWREKGLDGLRQSRPPGRPSRLSDTDIERLKADLIQGPAAHGYETELWTLARIRDVIEKVTGVSYHPNYVWYVLGDMGWTWQKPQCRARERDEEAISTWVNETWPRIKRGHSKTV